MATQANILEDLEVILARQAKTFTEILAVQEASTAALARIVELEALLAEGNVPDAIASKIAEVKAAAIATDELIPDQPESPASDSGSV